MAAKRDHGGGDGQDFVDRADFCRGRRCGGGTTGGRSGRGGGGGRGGTAVRGWAAGVAEERNAGRGRWCGRQRCADDAPVGPPGGSVGSLMVGAAVGLGGKLMRTVSFFG